MRQSIPRRVTGANGGAPAGRRGFPQAPPGEGWPGFAPSASHRNQLTRGAHQATERGREAGRGMGQTPMGLQISAAGVQSAGAITSGVAASAISGGGSFLGMTTAAVAIPVIGAVVAGVTLALVALFSRKGPKQKVATTQIVNKVEPLLQENLAGYMAGPRTVSSQAQAIENFKAGWQYVVDNCDVPVMGNPGQECVRDRQRGGEWPWEEYYLDPIVNDPGVIADPPAGSTVVRAADGTVTVTPPAGLLDTATGGAGIPASLLLGGVAIVAALMMGGGKS